MFTPFLLFISFVFGPKKNLCSFVTKKSKLKGVSLYNEDFILRVISMTKFFEFLPEILSVIHMLERRREIFQFFGLMFHLDSRNFSGCFLGSNVNPAKISKNLKRKKFNF